MRAHSLVDEARLSADPGDAEALRAALHGAVADLQAMSLRIARVAEIAVAVSRSLSIKAILDVLWQQTKWVVGFDHFVVVRAVEGEGWRVQPHGSRPEAAGPAVQAGGPLHRALTRGQPGIYPDAVIEGRAAPVASLLVVPLHVEREVVGALAFGRDGGVYGVDDLRIVTMLALQTAAMFRNAWRYEELQRLASELDAANALHRHALLNVMPAAIANEFTREGRVEPVLHAAATVVFIDLVGFTAAAARMTPNAVVAALDHLFAEFDLIVEAHGLEKLKTIGDAYMYVGGVSAPDPAHAQRAVAAALDILAHVQGDAAAAQARGERGWQVRIGIHSGPLVAGVVGRSRVAYDVWGDTVNVAARLEASGLPGRINISQATYDLVAAHYRCTSRGKIGVKGRGELPMFLVQGVTAPMAPVPATGPIRSFTAVAADGIG